MAGAHLVAALFQGEVRPSLIPLDGAAVIPAGDTPGSRARRDGAPDVHRSTVRIVDH